MPDEVADEGAFIAQFLAEEGGAGDAEPATAADETAEPEGGEQGGQSEPDVAEASADPPEGEPAGDDPATEIVPADIAALQKAIEAKDAKAFLEALGPAAADLLGSKAHKALRIAHSELKQREQRAKNVEAALMARYGDPIAIRSAASKGDGDAVVEGIEKFFGASWADLVKFVNASFAGKPARLEAKAAATKQADETAAAERKEAEAKVRNSITETVKASDAKLLAAYPGVVARVYDALRSGFHSGLRSPKAALAQVKKELESEYTALGKVFGKPPPARTPQLRQPRETPESTGRELTEQEFREQFLREQGLWRNK